MSVPTGTSAKRPCSQGRRATGPDWIRARLLYNDSGTLRVPDEVTDNKQQPTTTIDADNHRKRSDPYEGYRKKERYLLTAVTGSSRKKRDHGKSCPHNRGGCGFAALTGIRRLRRRLPATEITPVAPAAEFVYLPGLIRVAFGLRSGVNLRHDMGPVLDAQTGALRRLASRGGHRPGLSAAGNAQFRPQACSRPSGVLANSSSA
jgi:hypothetical protein